MAWMLDEYEMLVGHKEPGVITGKPLELGGSRGRGAATAMGGIYTIREAAMAKGINLEGATCAIQGFGNVGSHAVRLAAEILGMKVVAVSDEFGGIYHGGGIAYDELSKYSKRAGKVGGFPGSDEISNDELLTMDVDVLIPAAIENQITNRNADQIKATMIAELANGPTTPAADDVLFDKGIYIIPDFLCNAGGVTVSYFEMVQNSYGYYWDEKQVNQSLDQHMTEAFHSVHDLATSRNIKTRVAAYLVAVNRVAQAVRLRGWV
jgi:glutamate dehydrogenase (NAD(P)+)